MKITNKKLLIQILENQKTILLCLSSRKLEDGVIGSRIVETNKVLNGVLQE